MRFKSLIVFLCLPQPDFSPREPGFRIVETVRKEIYTNFQNWKFLFQTEVNLNKVQQSKTNSCPKFDCKYCTVKFQLFTILQRKRKETILQILSKTRNLGRISFNILQINKNIKLKNAALIEYSLLCEKKFKWLLKIN